jgi:hypothetical protein
LDSTEYLANTKTVAEIQTIIANTILRTRELTYTKVLPSKEVYEYEIAKSQMRFVLNEASVSNLPPRTFNFLTYEDDPAFFPFHAPTDAFLNDGSLRVHARNGYIFLPFAPEKVFRLYNILIDQTEINGAFYIKKSDNMNAQLQAFAQQNGIEIKIISDADMQKVGYRPTTDQENMNEYDICAFRYAQ